MRRIFVAVLAALHGVVSIHDTNLGISTEDRTLIFDRFYRADTARSREAGGAGLGLSIAKGIADTHRASIDVESTVGEGSTFQFRMARQA
jgi:signal transduction histidine kinase